MTTMDFYYEDDVATPAVAFRIVGPCPGCQSWQLEFADGPGVPLEEITPPPVAEAILREHAMECLPLYEMIPKPWPPLQTEREWWAALVGSTLR